MSRTIRNIKALCITDQINNPYYCVSAYNNASERWGWSKQNIQKYIENHLKRREEFRLHRIEYVKKFSRDSKHGKDIHKSKKYIAKIARCKHKNAIHNSLTNNKDMIFNEILERKIKKGIAELYR